MCRASWISLSRSLRESSWAGSLTCEVALDEAELEGLAELEGGDVEAALDEAELEAALDGAELEADLPICGPSSDPRLYRPCRELYVSGLPNQLGVGREN